MDYPNFQSRKQCFAFNQGEIKTNCLLASQIVVTNIVNDHPKSEYEAMASHFNCLGFFDMIDFIMERIAELKGIPVVEYKRPRENR